MIGLFAIVALWVTFTRLRGRSARIAAMTSMMGLQKDSLGDPTKAIADALQKAAPEVLPEVEQALASGNSEVREWSVGDKLEDLTKPGNHAQTTVKVRVTRW